VAAKPASRESAATPGHAATADGDPVSRRITELFCQILGADRVDPRADFFELGGHSLLAVRLLTRIEKEFKKPVALAELFQSPTVEGLAAIVRGTAAPKPREFRVLVPFNEQGTGPALYLVHSLMGEAASFRHLAGLLGPEQRLYGIQVPPERHNAGFATAIPAMASHYVEALLAFQPEGPYLLGGWSAGSTIALEMSRQLLATGRRVELLVALDGAPFNTNTGTSRWNPVYYGKLLINFPRWVLDDLLLEFEWKKFARRVRNKVVGFVKAKAAALRGRGNVRPEVSSFVDTSHFSESQESFMNALNNALYAYEWEPYPGRVLLYATRTQPLHHLLEVDKAWKKIAAQVDVVTVRGTHVSIVREPYIRTVAEDLRARLAELRTDLAP
jgi:thioesterase domain-containing protein/acyl carrier protein